MSTQHSDGIRSSSLSGSAELSLCPSYCLCASVPHAVSVPLSLMLLAASRWRLCSVKVNKSSYYKQAENVMHVFVVRLEAK